MKPFILTVILALVPLQAIAQMDQLQTAILNMDAAQRLARNSGMLVAQKQASIAMIVESIQIATNDPFILAQMTAAITPMPTDAIARNCYSLGMDSSSQAYVWMHDWMATRRLLSAASCLGHAGIAITHFEAAKIEFDLTLNQLTAIEWQLQDIMMEIR